MVLTITRDPILSAVMLWDSADLFPIYFPTTMLSATYSESGATTHRPSGPTPPTGRTGEQTPSKGERTPWTPLHLDDHLQCRLTVYVSDDARRYLFPDVRRMHVYIHVYPPEEAMLL